MKQLNFRHFNTKNTKNHCNSNFFQKQNVPRRDQYIPCLLYHGVFGYFPPIPDNFKISEDYRDWWRRQNTTVPPRANSRIFAFIFKIAVIFIWERTKCLQFTDSIFFSGREILEIDTNVFHHKTLTKRSRAFDSISEPGTPDDSQNTDEIGREKESTSFYSPFWAQVQSSRMFVLPIFE